MSSAPTEAVFPFPHVVPWATVPVGDYCFIRQQNHRVPTLKLSDMEAKCLGTNHPVLIAQTDLRVEWLYFPQWFARCHEAGHLVFGIEIGSEIYREDGIHFNPCDGSAVESGSWIKREPESEIRLSLAGVLTQLELADYSFNSALLPVLRRSVIINEENIPPGISTREIPSSGSAATDFATAEAAARRLLGESDARSVRKLLREHERAVRNIIRKPAFLAKVQLVAEDADAWLRQDGRDVWEEAILYGGLGAFYPNERARTALALL